MTARFLTGQYANLLEPRIDPTGLLAARFAGLTSEDPAFTRGRLLDDNVSSAFRFLTAASPSDIVLDLNMIPNGMFDSGWVYPALPYTSGWVQGPLVLTTLRDTAAGQFKTAPASLWFTSSVSGAPSTSWLAVDVPVRAGEALFFSGWTRNGGGSTFSRIYIQNLQTGRYLLSSGVWSPTVGYLVSTSGAVFVQGSLTFTVEPYLTCLADVVTLRIFLEVTTATASTAEGWFDDLVLTPAFNFMGIWGHTIPPFTVPTFQSGPTTSAATIQATMTPAQPAFYKILPALIYDRYVALRLTGAPPDASPIWIGELFLGQAQTLLRKIDPGMVEQWDDPQVRQATVSGHERVVSRTGGPRVGAELPLRFFTQAQYRQVRDEIFRRSRGGKYPIVFIPDDADPEVCIYGRLADGPLRNARQGPTFYALDGELAIVADPMPTFLA